MIYNVRLHLSAEAVYEAERPRLLQYTPIRKKTIQKSAASIAMKKTIPLLLSTHARR
jgi:hypothetical protein